MANQGDVKTAMKIIPERNFCYQRQCIKFLRGFESGGGLRGLW